MSNLNFFGFISWDLPEASCAGSPASDFLRDAWGKKQGETSDRSSDSRDERPISKQSQNMYSIDFEQVWTCFGRPNVKDCIVYLCSKSWHVFNLPLKLVREICEIHARRRGALNFAKMQST